MRGKRRFRLGKRSLATKLTVAMTMLALLAVASVTGLSLQRERQMFRHELEQQAETLLNSLVILAADALYFDNVDFLEDIVDQLADAEGLVAGRIYQQHGRLVADAHGEFAEKVYDLEADPFGLQLLQSKHTVFLWQADRLVAGKAVIFAQEPIGAISIGLPTAPLQAKVAAARDRGILVALAAAIAAALLATIVSRSITQPLQQLTAATQRLAKGDLSQTLQLHHSDDEIVILARAFNSMTLQLRKLIADLEDRADALQRSKAFALEKAQQLEEAMHALEKAKETAEVANRSKSQFLANMSHELRTPLNAILGFTQVISNDTPLNAQQQNYLDIVSRSGEHLLALIDDVLEMSKIEAGQTTLTETDLDLHRLLSNLQDMLQLKANSKDLELTFQQDPNLPQYIKADERKLRQVLINLLSNAIKFTSAGSVILRVNRVDSSWFIAHRKAQTKDHDPSIINHAPSTINHEPLTINKKLLTITLHFEVEDTGTGISPDDLDRLFAPFVQTQSGQQQTEGTGLGLSISQQFVQLMGGEIAVTSQLGKGSIFQFEIQVQLAEVLQPEPGLPLQNVVGLAAGQPDYRILIVEDNKLNRLLLGKVLKAVGFHVREARNGQEGVELWESWQPHLIWMDMQMPVMDGIEATRLIKAREQTRNKVVPEQEGESNQTLPSPIPRPPNNEPLTSNNEHTIVIALTASAFEEDRAQILAAGCDDFVSKPFKKEIVLEKLEKHLGVCYVREHR